MPIEYVWAERVHRAGRVPVLDGDQQRVVDHPGGPLLVLAGPGAGKTTTLVEVVVDRIVNRGLSPDQVLVLTFSRKAAEELRSRIALRLDRTTSVTPAMTFHSFCYGLVRSMQDTVDYLSPLRLLSAPENVSTIKELVDGTDPTGWPVALRPALGTRGFPEELDRLWAAARTHGLDALDLERLGASSGNDMWAAAGRFFDEYTGVAVLQNTVDYGGLVHDAVRLLADPQRRQDVRDRYRLVVVDEYQDTDPLQVELLQALAGDGSDLVAVGDPYQSIYGFRGADVGGILGFRTDFPQADGTPADQVVLTGTSRYGSTIAAAVSSIVTNRGVLGRVDGPEFDALRHLVPREETGGEVEVEVYTTPTAEVEHVAHRLRSRHLDDQVAWSDMAVLVRTSGDIARFQRTLSTAGVPVVVAGDELPLASESAVRTLLLALRTADTLARGGEVDITTAGTLLSGPLAGLDAPALRRLGRALREADRTPEHGPRPSRVLLAEALAQPAVLLTLAEPGSPTGAVAAAASRLASMLRRAADQVAAGESVERVLWTLWHGTSWHVRLRADATGGGEAAPRAHHDLDVLCALFSQAARAEEQHTGRSLAEFVDELEAQQIPADTLAASEVGSDAVQIMTAHRSKGLEWDTVVVVGVQEGVWPDLRHRGSLLRAERLGVDGETPVVGTRAALREERRLFYVACTRAKARLLVTAVASGSDDGDQPSVFVDDLWEHVHGRPGGEAAPVRTPRTRPVRPLSLRATVAALRRLGETTGSDVVRDRVARELARLAELPVGATRAANPDRWWGLLQVTDTGQPIRDPEQPIGLSASRVDSIVSCGLQWFLEHEAGGAVGTTTAQGFGSVVHAVAAEVAEQRLPADVEALSVYIDKIWDQLEFPAAWIGERERAEARDALVRFVGWHLGHGRTTKAAEHRFTVTTQVDGREVVLGGSMDRVEVDDDGVHVVDLKTSRSMPPTKDLAEHPQLGFYQLAVDLGATEDIAAGVRAAGAELVQLRNAAKKTPTLPVVQPQPGPTEGVPFFAVDQLARAVQVIGDEDFAATPSDKACRYCSFHRVCPAQPEGQSILDEGAGS